MRHSENFNLNLLEGSDQFNLQHFNFNTETLDTVIQDEIDNRITANENEATARSNADTALQNITNSTFKTALLNFCYPIGSIYWSSNSTNPATLFGGTWVQIKDRFVWAKGDSDTVDSTGGAKTVTLTKENLPSHNHNMQHYHTRGTMEIIGSIDNSSGNFAVTGFNAGSATFSGAFSGSLFKGKVHNGDEGTSSAAKIVTFTASDGWTGRTSGAYASQTDGDTATKTVTGNTGSGTTVDKMPPYVVKYCWERTA